MYILNIDGNARGLDGAHDIAENGKNKIEGGDLLFLYFFLLLRLVRFEEEEKNQTVSMYAKWAVIWPQGATWTYLPALFYFFLNIKNVHHLIFSREKKRKIEKEKRQKGLTFSQSRSQMTCKIKKKKMQF